jgi:hypothetical protein
MGGRIIVVDASSVASTSSPTTVFANGGSPGPGGACVFPFEYQGVNYSQCTCVDVGQPWCSLSSNFDLGHTWGYCRGSFTQSDRTSCIAGAASGASPIMATDSDGSHASSSSSSSSATVGTIVGAVFGIVAVVAILGLAVHHGRQRIGQRLVQVW